MADKSIFNRMHALDQRLRSLDAKIDTKLGAKKSPKTPRNLPFGDVLKSFESKEAEKVVHAKELKDINPGEFIPKAYSPKDNLSKLPQQFDTYISQVVREVSKEENVQIEENLILSLIKQESNFNPEAQSKSGAKGLMQLMPETAKTVGVFDTHNPYQNVRGGVRYFAKLLKQFDGNIQNALAAYNAGPTTVRRYRGVPPFRETQNYVKKIMKDYLARENYKPIDTIG